MPFTTAQLAENRARILAMVQFTSREDLLVTELRHDYGLDLLVQLGSDRNTRRQHFGVILKATTELLEDEPQAAAALRSLLRGEGNQPSPSYAFPIIVTLFSMPNDRGYYAWLAEPVIAGDNAPHLKHQDTVQCSPFDRHGLAEIVRRVNEWYDSLFARLLAA